MTGVGFANQNVWSRAARRQRKTLNKQGWDAVENEDLDEAALGFKVQAQQKKPAEQVEVLIRWLKGNDAVLFESFYGMLRRQLENR